MKLRQQDSNQALSSQSGKISEATIISSWLALSLVPLITLTNLSITYALVTPSCVAQNNLWIHALTGASLLASMVLTWLALRDWRRQSAQYSAGNETVGTSQQSTGQAKNVDSSDANARQLFIACIATLTGALFCLVLMGMSIAHFLLSPCFQ